jgi:hypothetical protein
MHGWVTRYNLGLTTTTQQCVAIGELVCDNKRIAMVYPSFLPLKQIENYGFCQIESKFIIKKKIDD